MENDTNIMRCKIAKEKQIKYNWQIQIIEIILFVKIDIFIILGKTLQQRLM